MKHTRRPTLVISAMLAVVLLAAAQSKPPVAKAEPKKIQNTDLALRMKAADQHQALKAQTPFKDMKWRFIGPDIFGGRCVDIAVPRGSRNVIYIASAVGGLWKTENTGITWECLTNDLPTLSSGDVDISESNPDIVYYGTGEANIFRASMAGTGVYKSADAGKTWTPVGLTGTYTIGRIRIHPTNPDIVYVAASGHEWTYGPDRGVFKTVDGGKTWQKVLYLDEKIGAIDLVMDPKNPDTLIASMCHRIRLRWSDPVPEPGDGLFKTTDGGKTWKPANAGLPDTKFTGRIGLDLCRTKPNVVYAYVDNHTPVRQPAAGDRDSYGRLRTFSDIAGAEVYRSDDQGDSWRKVSASDRTMERFGGTYGWVFGQIRVDPSDDNMVYIMGLGLSKSTDGAKTFKPLYGDDLHGDHHGLWIDPADSNYIINVNDGGANVSYDGGKNWRDFHKGIPSIQFYNVTLDMAKPFAAYGSVQDQGTVRGLGVGPSGAPAGGRRGMRGGAGVRWEFAPGGEGTIIAVDPTNPNLEYASTYYGRVMRSEYKDGQWSGKDIYPKPAAGEPEYRGQWLAPTILSPHDPATIYHGFQYVFRSKDKGDTWTKISPDLTYNDPRNQGRLPYAISYAALTAIDESPLKAGVLYAGTDDGRVHVTLDGGAKWTEITAGLPYNKHVWNITASKYDAGTVYVSLIGRHDDDFNPYVFKSTDYGKTWVNIAAALPGSTNVLREDPKKAGVLYCGTDLGPYVTTDGGKTWAYLGAGMPNVAVWDIQIHPRDNVIVAATNGRGMWVIDDASPVQK
jgi:photosystem II stability/assembly factor-like uncharacterized protein